VRLWRRDELDHDEQRQPDNEYEGAVYLWVSCFAVSAVAELSESVERGHVLLVGRFLY
jgi:hypothetical protein